MTIPNFADILSLISPIVEPAPFIRVRLNVGMMMDILSGEYVKQNGRYILNGGLHGTIGIAGCPNTFKSTLMMTMTAIAVDRLLANNVPTQITTYDTEDTLERQRIQAFVDMLPTLASVNPLVNGVWTITTKNQTNGSEWWESARKAAKMKIKSSKQLMVDTPYIDDKGNVVKVILPTFNHLDSITAFRSKDTDEIDDKAELGDAKGLMLYMKAGLAKSRFLTALSSQAERSNTYFMISAHVGDLAPDMNASPYAPKVEKKMPTMRSNQRYKGVTDNFFSLLGGIWQTHRVAPLYVDKKPMYPKDKNDTREFDTDLMCVNVQLMRSKASGDGDMIELIISKTSGFLPSLSEFHHIKTNDKFGLPGNDHNYVCALYPECKLNRSNIRTKLKDVKLQRAINICSEMLQIYTLRKYTDESFRMSPEELYTSLSNKGYSWDKILTSRGWHSLGHPPKDVLTVTTMDLLAMAVGELDLPEFKINQEGT